MNSTTLEFTHFESQLDSSNSAPTASRMDAKKRLANASIGVVAIAAVACIALVFVNAGPSDGSSTYLQTTSSQQKFTLNGKQSLTESYTLLDRHVNNFLQLQEKYGLTSQRLMHIVTGIARGDQHQIQRIAALVLNYTFNLVDTTEDASVDKTEWDAFIKAVFPADVALYGGLFNEINGGKAFTYAQFVAYITKNIQHPSDFLKYKPTTDKKVTSIAFAKLIVNDDRNYENTYKLVFQIFDENNDQTITITEFESVLIVFGVPKSKATREAHQFFEFINQNTTTTTITFAHFAEVSQSIRPFLQQKLKDASTVLQLQLTQNQLYVTQLSMHAEPLMQLAYDHAFSQVDKDTTLTSDQQKVLVHLFQTISEYEFSLFDTDKNKVITQKEFRAVIDQIFKNADDQKHYYADFDGINGGKDVTLTQFQQKLIEKVQNVNQVYQPKEKKELIEKRAGLFIINNKQNYALTYNFIFNLFDINSDKVVSVAEIHNAFAIFVTDKQKLSTVDAQIQNVFNTLKSASVGDGSKITLAQWTAFAQKIQPQLAQALDNATKSFFMFISM